MSPPATPSDGTNPTRGIVLILTAYVLFIMMDTTAKYLMDRYHFTQIMAIRFWVFFAVALVLARRRGILSAFKTRLVFVQIVRAAALGLEMSLIVFSFSRLPLADVHAVLTLAPLFVLLMAGVFLKETIGLRGWISVLAGFAGAMMIIRPGFSGTGHFALLVLPLIASFLWAIYGVLSRLVGRTDSAETTLLYTTLVCMIGFSVAVPSHWLAPTLADGALMLMIAVLGAAGHFAIIKAFTLAPASLLQPYTYSIFLYAIVMGAIFFGDVPDWPTVAGAVVIIGAGIYASDRDGRLWARVRHRLLGGP